MKKVIAALLISCFSLPAFAWGDREQGILSGIAGYWMLQKLNEPKVVVEQQPSVVVQQPRIIHRQGPVGVEYYNCLVRVYDPQTGYYRNEVMTCVR